MRVLAGSSLALGLILQACTPLYVAPVLNAPQLADAGELHAAGAIEATSGSLEFNLAFAPADYVGLMAAASSSALGERKHEHTYVELGAGTFVPFGIGRFETFLGAGYGDARGDILLEIDQEDHKFLGTADYSLFFLQADIGLELDHFECGALARGSHTTFWHTSEEDQVRRTVQEMFWEIGAFFRAGWRHVKFEFQAQFVIPSLPTAPIATSVFQVALAIHVDFDLY